MNGYMEIGNYQYKILFVDDIQANVLLLKALKKEENLEEIPIIFLTALDNTSSIVKGFKLGTGNFVLRLCRKEELMVRIYYHLSLVATYRAIIEQRGESKKVIANRDKLYSVIAHNLRLPMAFMKMLLNIILMSVGRNRVDPDIYDMLKTSNHTSEELFALLDNPQKWTKLKLI